MLVRGSHKGAPIKGSTPFYNNRIGPHQQWQLTPCSTKMKKDIKSAAAVESEAQTLETDIAASAVHDVHGSTIRTKA